MKNIGIIVFWLSCSTQLSAQTSDEWLRQRATQKKYLLQQIQALQVYTRYLSRGYTIVKDGLTTIKDIKNGDFNQHSGYFSSLFTVNPTIKRYARISDIIVLQMSVARQSHNAMTKFKADPYFDQAEIYYLKDVYNDLLAECAKNLDDLFAVITDGTLQMKDDERIRAIDKLYLEMQDKQEFVRAFTNSAVGLSLQRSNDQNNIIISKKLNGLK